MAAIWTCEDHGSDIVVVFYGASNCPVCREIGNLEAEKTTLESEVESLKSEIDTLKHQISELESAGK